MAWRRYYGKAACKTVLTEIRVETLKRYGIETALAPRYPDPAAREAAICEQAANLAANSLIILRRAPLGFDTRADFARIKAKVLSSCAAPTRCSRQRSRPTSSRR
ncbi:MAG TPA: hypothetical protein VHT21_22155 [Stellaceae bacterium]|jgi:homoserine O-acetyltransferase|nr:hypothetical protein [Stellaceae bacterium]